ncbi:MAG: tetratricopeptide repeat protein [Nitrospiraceae bacterium]|nr:tetratricopeptide repeat protein [Nitrospiraceae bacterium]
MPRFIPFLLFLGYFWAAIDPVFALPLNDPTYPSPLRQGVQEAARQILANHPKKALTILNPLFKLYPDYTIVFTLGGMAYGKSGLNKKAIEMERRALALDPDNITAKISLGIAEGNTGHFRRELAEENAVIQKDPKREPAWKAAGWAYASLGQWKAARFSEEKAIDLRPSDAGARMILGLALAHEGYLQEALLMEESARRIDPQDEGIRRSITFIKHEMAPHGPRKSKTNGFNPILAPTPGPASSTATPESSQQTSPPPIRAPSVLH